MGEIGYGRELDYQPGEHEWAQVLASMDGILSAAGQNRDNGAVDASWDSDQLQKRFTLVRQPLASQDETGQFRYHLRIQEMFSNDDESTIMTQSDALGIRGMLGPIVDEADAGLSDEPIENAELLLNLYLSSYTMDNNV